jgi:hypothetical protein
MGRGVASGESPDSLQQRFAFPAVHLTWLGAVGVQDSQIGALQKAPQRRTSRFDAPAADVPMGAAVIDPLAIPNRLRPRFSSVCSIVVDARARRMDQLGE